MKKFLQSLGTFAPQTVRTIISSAQFAIDSNQPTEFNTTDLSITCIPCTEPDNPVVHVQVTDTTQEFNDTQLAFNYNHEGEFFTGVVMQSHDKPKPQPQCVGIIVAMLTGANVKGLPISKN